MVRSREDTINQANVFLSQLPPGPFTILTDMLRLAGLGNGEEASPAGQEVKSDLSWSAAVPPCDLAENSSTGTPR